MSRPWMPVTVILLGAMSCWAAPQTQPAEPAQRELLVLPVAPPANGAIPWVGKSIQQDVTADLSQASKLRVAAPASAAPAADVQDALRAARDAGASFVVFGQSQISGNQLRVTGNLLDAIDGKTLGSLKATAPIDDLFPMEDSLAAQAIAALPADVRMAPPAAIAQAPATQPYLSSAVPVPQYQPQQYPSAPYAPPYYSYTEPLPDSYYIYNYGYPSYWAYGYYPWWWGTGVFIDRDFDDFHHHHDLDFDHFGHGPYYSPRPAPHGGGFSHGPAGHEFGHYGIGGPNVMGHGFGGARPGLGGGGGGGGGGHAGGGHQR